MKTTNLKSPDPAPRDLPIPTWEIITPELARQYLALNHKNRKLREATTTGYARDMMAGNWLPTHQGIAFDDQGRLIDGQHRLAALIRAGVSLPFLVSRGWPERPRAGAHMNQMDAVDMGAARSLADQLTLQHEVPNARLTAAVCQVVGQLCFYSRSRKGTVPQLLGILDQFKPGIEFALDELSVYKPLHKGAVLGALAFAYGPHPEQLKSARRKLYDGTGLEAGAPMLVLRNFLLGDASARTSYSGTSKNIGLAQICLRAFHLGVTGQSCRKLEINHDSIQYWRDQQELQVAAVRKLMKLPEIESSARSGKDGKFISTGKARQPDAIAKALAKAQAKREAAANPPQPTPKPTPLPTPKLSAKEQQWRKLRETITVPASLE